MREPISCATADLIDDDLSDLEVRLQAALGIHVRDLVLMHSGEVVVLRGSTQTYHAKQLAQHAVMEFGYRVLVNEIEVR